MNTWYLRISPDISWYLRKQVGVIAYPMYERLRRFPASQEDKYRDKINKNKKNKIKYYSLKGQEILSINP